MRASNSATRPGGGAADLGAGMAELVDGVLAGRSGFTVRCRPTCRTLMVADAAGELVFCKLREDDRRAAAREWHWLHVLPMLGLGVPQPLWFERRGRRTLLCTARAPGRPLDALLREALRRGDAGRALAFACEVVAPRVRQLHEQGLVFRDLYWSHLFAASLEVDSDLVFLDVERVFRPRWRRFRWFVKDLAGLWSSLPLVPTGGDAGAMRRLRLRAGMRFLRSYLGSRAGDAALRRSIARAVARKAARIRAHAPRYGY